MPSTTPTATPRRAVGIGALRLQQVHDTLNWPLTAGAYPAAEAVSLYPSPRLSMLRFAKVATPLAATTVVVPERVPAPGLFEI